MLSKDEGHVGYFTLREYVTNVRKHAVHVGDFTLMEYATSVTQRRGSCRLLYIAGISRAQLLAKHEVGIENSEYIYNVPSKFLCILVCIVKVTKKTVITLISITQFMTYITESDIIFIYARMPE